MISNRLYPIPIRWPRIAFAFAAAVVCFMIGGLAGHGATGTVARAVLALVFAFFVWRAVLEESDREELKKVVGL